MAIEKAKQYLEFSDYLRRRHDITCDSDALETFKGLDKYDRVQDNYAKLDLEDIMNVVEDHLLALQSVPPFGEYYPKTCSDRIRKNPIINLVYRVVEGGYVMDRDPLMELDVIKKSYPDFHLEQDANYFCVQLAHQSAISTEVIQARRTYAEFRNYPKVLAGPKNPF